MNHWDEEEEEDEDEDQSELIEKSFDSVGDKKKGENLEDDQVLQQSDADELAI